MSNRPSPNSLLIRKRRKSESTQPITNFFPTLKRQRSISENDVSQKLENCQHFVNNNKKINEEETRLDYSDDKLCEILEVEKTKPLKICATLESLPSTVYNRIFTILDLKSLSSLAVTSKVLSNNIKKYVCDCRFYYRFELDYLDFLNSTRRFDDDDFLEKDPFFAYGVLIKSITITMSTDKRALVFLNVCRNLNTHLKKDLCGFGRILDGMTHCWMFSERRIIVKAAILIDSSLHEDIIKVLKDVPGKYLGLEMKIRSKLTELFLNRSQDIDGAEPDSIIEFGSWLSILLNNFTEKYQGKLYYILFGPSILCRTGEKIAWDYFIDRIPLNNEETNQKLLIKHRSRHVVKTRLTALLNGLRALRIMSAALRMDISWNNKRIYRLFLRVVEASSVHKNWSVDLSSMALAIDTSGLLSEYLMTCCDPEREDFQRQQKDAAQMICQVRANLYSWSATPSTFLSEPLHQIFNKLSRIDGNVGGTYYKSFLNEIWKVREQRLCTLSKEMQNNPIAERLFREELQGQVSMLRLLCGFSDAMILQRRREMNGDFEIDALEQDEQIDDNEWR